MPPSLPYSGMDVNVFLVTLTVWGAFLLDTVHTLQMAGEKRFAHVPSTLGFDLPFAQDAVGG